MTPIGAACPRQHMADAGATAWFTARRAVVVLLGLVEMTMGVAAPLKRTSPSAPTMPPGVIATVKPLPIVCLPWKVSVKVWVVAL